MSATSPIEWTDATWNPIVGCSIVSPGCTHCYAMRHAARIEKMNPGSHYDGTTRKVNGNAVWTGKLALAPDHILHAPLSWRKPKRIFVNSMGDLFHEDVPDESIDRVFAVMALTPQHTYQVLTKSGERMRSYLTQFDQRGRYVCSATRDQVGDDRRDGNRLLFLRDGQNWPLPHVWLGVSAEDQTRADDRIPHLLQTPAAVRFVSLEPLLGEIDLNDIPWPKGRPSFPERDDISEGRTALRLIEGTRLDWVIVGGESGAKARPMHPDWARSLRDQCAAAGVPFFFKQWGEWGEPTDDLSALEWPYHPDHDRTRWFDSRNCARPIEPNWSDKYRDGGGALDPPPFDLWKTPEYLDQVARCPQPDCIDAGTCLGNKSRAAMTRVGKKAAGRLLDGVEHNAMPVRT